MIRGLPVHRLRGDRGAGVAEAAIITPVVLLLVFSIFEFGLYFRSYLTVGDAAGDGTRIGGIVGPDKLDIGDSGTPVFVAGDYAIVAAIREATASIPPSSIDRIVVFWSANPGFGSAVDQVRPACKTSPVSLSSQRCNVYPAEEAFLAVQDGDYDYFDCAAGGVRACGWPSADRNDGPDVDEIDYLGVYIRVEHPWVTGIFGDTATIEQASIIRLEPGEVE